MTNNSGKLTTDYDNFSETFSNSRKTMKWPEIDYFLENYFGKLKKSPYPPLQKDLLLDNFSLGKERNDLGITNKNGSSENKNGKIITLLDVGCGNGRILNHFSSVFCSNDVKYIGIDSSSGMINEAKKNNKNYDFFVLDMLDLDSLQTSLFGEKESKKFDFIFFIASFHHLDSLEKRLDVLKKVKKLLNKNGIIFMTNWSLESTLNKEKYSKFKIAGSENKFGSSDFSIKIGKYNRFYHSFSIGELDYLFRENNFEVIENREFENKKNIISIIKKTK